LVPRANALFKTRLTGGAGPTSSSLDRISDLEAVQP